MPSLDKSSSRNVVLAGVIELLHSDRPISKELAVQDSVIFPEPVLLGLNPKQSLVTPTEQDQAFPDPFHVVSNSHHSCELWPRLR